MLSLAALLLAGTLEARAQSAQTSLTDPAQAELFREVSEGLVCQCGCNMILHVCNHVGCPSAVPFREKIEGYIQEGMTKEQILARFVADEGTVVLSAPTTKGFNLTAWVMPFVALVLGGAGVAMFLLSRRRPADRAPEGPSAASLAPERAGVDARVEAEFRDFGD